MQIFLFFFFQMKYLGKPLNFCVHLSPIISSGQASQNWTPDYVLMLAKKVWKRIPGVKKNKEFLIDFKNKCHINTLFPFCYQWLIPIPSVNKIISGVCWVVLKWDKKISASK